MLSELQNILLTVAPDDAGKRLDSFLSEKIGGWSRSRLQKLIAEGDCVVNDRESKASYKLRSGDEVEIELSELAPERFLPEEIPLSIVYEDEHLAVVNKPSGMVVHPGAGVSSGTLANALAFHFGVGTEDIDASTDATAIDRLKARIGLVHRLDRDTSGLIVVAKNESVHEALSEQFRNRTVKKEYVALVHGETETDTGTVEAPIAREKHHRTRMGVRAHGRYALTLWKVKRRFWKFTLLGVEIKTGRTHQIRVHLAHINHPIVGDELYNAGRDKTVADLGIRKAISDLGRFFLHAAKLSFTHPATGERLDFSSPLPDELVRFLELLDG